MNFLVINFKDGEKIYHNIAEIHDFYVGKDSLTISFCDFKANEDVQYPKKGYKSWELI